MRKIAIIFITLLLTNGYSFAQDKKISEKRSRKLTNIEDRPCCCVMNTIVELDSSAYLKFLSFEYVILDTIKIKKEQLVCKKLSHDSLFIEFYAKTNIPEKFKSIAFHSSDEWINIDYESNLKEDTVLHFIKENVIIKWPLKKVPDRVLFHTQEIKFKGN